MIEIKSLTKIFGDKIIFDNTSFSLPSKGLFILDSDNGSGKTTLLKILIGRESTQNGEILFNGKIVENLACYCTYLDQKFNFVSFLTLKDNYNLKSFIYKGRNAQIDEKNLAFIKRRRPSKLSEGEKILLLLEKAFNEPEPIILLDEVTSHLDDENTKIVLDKIIEISKSKLVLLATHDFRIDSHGINKLTIVNKKIIVENVNFELVNTGDSVHIKHIENRKKPLNLRLFFKYLLAKPALTLLFLATTIFLNITFSSFIYSYSFDPSIVLNDFNLSFLNTGIESKTQSYKFNGSDINLESSGSLNSEEVLKINEIFPNAVLAWDDLIFDNSDEDYLKLNQKIYNSLLRKGNYNNFYYASNKIYYINDGFSFILDYKIDNNILGIQIDYDYFLSCLERKCIGTNSIIFESELNSINDKASVFTDEKVTFTDSSVYEKENGISITMCEDEIIVGEKYKPFNGERLNAFNLGEFNLYGDRNNYFDLEETFPSGIKVRYDKSISSRLHDNEVLALPETFDKLLSTINFKRNCQAIGTYDTSKLISYIVFGNDTTPLNAFTFVFCPRNDSTILSTPNRNVEMYYDFLYLAYHQDVYTLSVVSSVFILFVFLFIIYFYYSKESFKKDFDILSANGLSKNKPILFEILKCFVLYLISILPGIIVILNNPSLMWSYNVGFNPFTFNGVTMLLYLVLFLILLAFVLIINYKENIKKKIKSIFKHS